MDRVFPAIIDSIVFTTAKPAVAFPLSAHRPEALVAHRPRPQMRRLRCDDDDDPRMWVALSPLHWQSQVATSSHRSTRGDPTWKIPGRNRTIDSAVRAFEITAACLISYRLQWLQIGSGCSATGGLSIKYNMLRLRNLCTWRIQIQIWIRIPL